MNEWLVRTAQNIIVGPYSKDEVCRLIEDGTLGLYDEVCPANGYWFYLHERNEVLERLGIEISQLQSQADESEEKHEEDNKDEITETETKLTPSDTEVAAEEKSDNSQPQTVPVKPLSPTAPPRWLLFVVAGGLVGILVLVRVLFKKLT
jgi:hypothetical protein